MKSCYVSKCNVEKSAPDLRSIACCSNNSAFLEDHLFTYSTKLRNSQSNTFHVLARRPSAVLFSNLARCVYAAGKTPLRMACNCVHKPCVESLIRHGAEVDHRDMEGRSIVYIMALENRPECISLLTDAGAGNDGPFIVLWYILVIPWSRIDSLRHKIKRIECF